MFNSKKSLLAWTVASLAFILPHVSAQCNPLTATCPPNTGLAKNEYFIDFTRQTKLPEGWILADYASIKYGSMGAEFAFFKRYDAPYIWTNFYIHFGRVEVVMQAALGTAMISSAVLMSDTQDEIDWEWSGNNFATDSGKVQTNYFGKGITGNYDRGTMPSVSSPQTKFHTYTIDWTPTSITWLIDGKTVRVHKASDSDTGTHQYPQSPSKFHLGLWCAGDPDTHPATAEWAGGRTDFRKGPFTAYVKSVKITNMNPCGQYEYGDKSGDWQSIKCLNSTLTSSSSSSTTISSTSISLVQSSTSPISSVNPSSTSSAKPLITPASSISSPVTGSSSTSSTASNPNTVTPSSIQSSSASTGPTSKPSFASITDTKAASNTPSSSSAPMSNTIRQGTIASTSTPASSTSPISKLTTPASSQSSTTASIPLSPSPSSSTAPTSQPPPVCHQDNCLRALLNPRHAISATAFCKTYIAPVSSSTSPPRPTTTTVHPALAKAATIPTWLANCAGNGARVASACRCLGLEATATAAGGSATGTGVGGARPAHMARDVGTDSDVNADDVVQNEETGKRRTRHAHTHAHAHAKKRGGGWLHRRAGGWF